MQGLAKKPTQVRMGPFVCMRMGQYEPDEDPLYLPPGSDLDGVDIYYAVVYSIDARPVLMMNCVGLAGGLNMIRKYLDALQGVPN